MQILQVPRPTILLPEQLAATLPIRLVDAIRKCGASTAEELRLHRGRIATVTCKGRTYPTNIALTESEMNEIFRRMCAGSLYAFQETVNNGYLAMDGGIRVGVCGSASMEADKIIGVCTRYGIEISDFFASDGFVRGQLFHGKTVLSFSQIKEKYGKDFIELINTFIK